MFNKMLGSVLIVAGTAIGAGMLALPLAASHLGFWHALGLLTGVWLLMLYTAFLILEVALALKTENNSFQSMALATLGRPGQALAWLSCLLLLYALTAAYITGAGSLLSSLLQNLLGWQWPFWVNAALFLGVFGSIVFHSTRAVDLFNRNLMGLKGLALIVALAVLSPEISLNTLSTSAQNWSALTWVAPVFITSFGFHTVIPSLIKYLGPNPRALQRVLVLGTLLPFGIYVFWLACSLGTLPLQGENSFAVLHQGGDTVPQFMAALSQVKSSWLIHWGLNFFANIAMTTSFLGVSLGLFDFLAEASQRANHRLGRAQTAALTFLPPFVVAVFYPKGFVMALAYAGMFVAILEVILPALMVYQLRRSTQLSSLFRVPGGHSALLLVFLIGCWFVYASFPL